MQLHTKIPQQPKQPMGRSARPTAGKEAANRYDAGSCLISSNFSGVLDTVSIYSS